jgi:hypothetical protein
VVGATVLAGAITGIVLAFAVNSGTQQTQKSDPAAAVLSRLSPQERQYVQGITSMTPAQLKAAFGTGPDAIDALGLDPKDEAYVRGIVSLTPVQIAAAYGTGLSKSGR